MLIPVLVATPHNAFGELLRTSVEDGGQYKVRLVQSAKEVRETASQDSIHLAILDAALADEPFVPLCMSLVEQQPGIRLVVIPPDNNPNHPALGGLIPHGYLSRPFYLPELMDLVSRLAEDREKQFQQKPLPNSEPARALAEPSPSTPQPWLHEPKILTSYLEKQLPATQAVAAIIGLKSAATGSNSAKGVVRTCAGILSESAAQELVEIIFRYWNSAEKTDLMRFVRLSTDKKDFQVYATRITGELVLALLYDTSAALSRVRSQTKALAQRLAAQPTHPGDADQQANPVTQQKKQPDGSEPVSPPSENPPSVTHPEPPRMTPAHQEPATQPLDDNQFIGRGSTFSPETNTSEEKEPARDIPAEETPDIAEDEGEIGGRLINLSALLGVVPSPNPEEDSRRAAFADAGWVSERQASSPIPTLPGGFNSSTSIEKDQVEEQRSLAEEQRPKKRTIRTAPSEPQTMSRNLLPDTPSLPVDYALPVDHEKKNWPKAGSGRPAGLEVKTEPPVMPPGISAPVEPPRAIDIASNLALEQEPSDLALEDTHPNVVSTITNLSQLESASPALSLLNYTCVLIPRLPQHYLASELADRMALWVQQLCLAFGWRLEGIAIRPEYLQWTVQVAPAISPGNLVRIVRQRTSLNVFNNYSHLANENPSGDFWATGYLIVSGSQPPSAQLLREYIAQTRKRQGVSK